MTIETLFAQLKNPNPHLRERAMREIVEQRDENTIPRLMDNLASEDMVYRRSSVKTLGFIGTDAVEVLVESLLKNESPTIRASCAKALAQVAFNYPNETFPEQGLQGLKQAMNDPNPVVHIASVIALGEVGSPALDILVETLKTTDNIALAVAIINALGSIGDGRAETVLQNLANDDTVDPYIKESANSALSRLEMVMNYKRS